MILPRGARSRVLLAAKAAVSVALVIYLLERAGLDAVWREISRADAGYLALYVILGLLGILVSAEKWRVLALPRGMDVGLRRLFVLYLVGYFFNQFLPTSVGGDVVRSYELGRLRGRHREAMASVFMERFTGMTTLVVLALVALLSEPRYAADSVLTLSLGAAALAYLLVTWLVFRPPALDALGRILRFPVGARAVGNLRRVQRTIFLYRRDRGTLAAAGGYSLLFYGLAVVNVYTACLALGVEVPLTTLGAAVPLMLLHFTIPVSIGGVGLQEWAYAFVLSKVGVPLAAGLSLGLVFRARTVVFGLVGGLLYPFVSQGLPPELRGGDLDHGGPQPPSPSGV